MATPDTPPTLADRRRLPYRSVPGFSPLFATYCTDFEPLAPYFSGDWRREEDRRRQADAAAHHQRHHDQLADILLEQNARWGMDHATREHIEALRGAETVAVVTGQQVGVLTGPLYTPYKTITTLQLAEQLAEETGRPVVPVFWLEGGDHDLEEVSSLRLLRQNQPHAVQYGGHTLPEHGNLGPVGLLKLTSQIEHVLAQVEELLTPSDFRDDLMARLHDAYQPGATLLDAFARLMRSLFPDTGLVFIDQNDPRLKRLAAPLFRREVEDYDSSFARLSETSDVLARDFHAQVHPRRTNLFLVDAEGRFPLDVEEDRFVLRGRGVSYTQDDLLALLNESPERFSPNVVLRPLMQDWLLPTAAYVGGPGEVAYFAQYKGVYDWAGVPMPIIYPRSSVTIVESKVEKVLERFGLDVPDFAEDPDRLFQRVVVQEMEVDVDAVFKEAARNLHQAVNALKPHVERVDRTLVRSAEATRAALLKEFESFKARVLRAEKQNHESYHAQLDKARVNLFPDGVLQERALSVLYYLNKYGPDLLLRMRRELSLDTSEHQVITL